ncbi:hypothetical protein RHOER0001_5619 [Rhodococcus erythropolis SK121]|nr:hypothetical protein RHOER0001_5619 [Rhodococcus erythropolis SK121]
MVEHARCRSSMPVAWVHRSGSVTGLGRRRGYVDRVGPLAAGASRRPIPHGGGG